ncbi:hypothetical protein Cs7R123_12660 [Catellatospora sp. TT07R-123]|uniref:GGDEF domain-containing protein n=1 Tax=Catellatospora sp. TT07R-123 TaxID=2733863 RepID=UPI001AFD6CE6|nr:GGDEF domain-containing protein [Catellatospora sp. TT07R-123]GHJ43924.1 hypothetical protein Cs7R123_12660 [Catellatospora sp. TT07R-123]
MSAVRRWLAALAAWWRDGGPLLDRFARLGPRLIFAFLAVSLLLPLVGLVAVREQHSAGARAAQAEGERVARHIAHNIVRPLGPGQPRMYQRLDELQQYIGDLHQDLGRDVEVVDRDLRILADAVPGRQGQLLRDDPLGQVAATMRDGVPRAFTERGDDYPHGIEVVAVPVRGTKNAIVGAVLLEYTSTYRELTGAGVHITRAMAAASMLGMTAALVLGYLLAYGIVRDVRRLTRAADLLAAGHDDVRVAVGSRGELGRLAAAFNTMAERISEQKAMLTDLATSDPLTGLRNRRSFHAQLETELDKARALGSALSVLMLDLDEFKSINDRYGHLAGDAALSQVAAAIQQQLRADDVAARLGGEEFGVLLHTGSERAFEVAERLRAAVARTPIRYEELELSITVSIGVVSCPVHGQTSAALLQRADEALYRAKRDGRDRVCGPPDAPA